MSTATAPTLPEESPLIQEIRILAAEREHRLAARLLGRPMTGPQAEAIARHLRTRPVKPGLIPAGLFPAGRPEAPVAQQVPQPPAGPGQLPSIRSFTDVPDGRYAVPSRTGSNDLDFFWVDRPSDGKWQGYTFVKRVIGGHADASLDQMQARRALLAIRTHGVEEAGMLYATKLRRCRACNIHLTDELSRERGYGPDCWENR